MLASEDANARFTSATNQDILVFLSPCTHVLVTYR